VSGVSALTDGGESVGTAAIARWRPGVLRMAGHALDLSRRVAVMGIVNATPDSFYDGGLFASAEAAIEHGLRLAEDGADLIDVGGDSAGGGAPSIDADEEIRRVLPVVRGLVRQTKVLISIDTHRAATAAAALDAGAAMVNDITGLADPDMAPTVGRGGAGLCVMHIRGAPKHYPPDFDYGDVVEDVRAFLEQRVRRALDAGVARDRLVIDPGIEFGKLLTHDLELLRRLDELHALRLPVLVAVSRKHFIGHILRGVVQPDGGGDGHGRVEERREHGVGAPPDERLEGTAAAVTFAITRGAHIVRVHDVREMVRVVRVTEALVGLTFGDPEARIRSDGVVVPE
jgi:dihydropteroate synthase